MRLKNLLLIVMFFLCLNCSGAGTEVGNPTVTTRAAFGALTSVSISALRKLEASEASCPSSGGDVSIVFRTLAGETVSATLTDDAFSTELSQTERYEVVFEQNSVECGYLIYGSDQAQAGLRVALGKGDIDIDFGVITDEGNGVFVSTNNPSTFCDDDDDDLPDDEDSDDDGDGIDDHDDDFDGYIDWFDDDEDEDDGTDDDSTVSGEAGCTIDYLYPSSVSGFELDDVGDGELEIHLASDIVTVSLEDIVITNSSGTVVVNGIGASDFEITDSEQTFEADVTLSPGEDYTLTIAAGAFTCTGGNSTTAATSIDFFTYTDD